MEQIFNFKRFIKYGRYQLASLQKSTLLILGGAFVALFLFLFMMVSSKSIRSDNEWMGAFFGTSVVFALLLIGNAFPSFRKRNSTLIFLTMPASLLEKYLFEVVLKMVLFVLLYPLVFKFVGEMTVVFADFTFPKDNHYDFTYAGLIKFSQEEFFPIIPWLYVFGASIAFAGATAFRRLPLIKTLVFLGIVIGSIVGYFYLLIEKIHLGRAIGYFIENSWIKEEEYVMVLGIVLLAISSLTALAYAFFNVKEREV